MLWEKLAGRRRSPSLTSVAGQADRRAPSDPRLRAAVEEACAVAVADGADMTFAEQWAIIESLPDRPTTSTARDVAAGRPSELDAIAGGVVRAGRRLGVPTHLRGAARSMPSVIGLIGARSGSERVADKTSAARGTPAARVRDRDRAQSGVCERVVVSTDSEEIADVAAGTAPTFRSSTRGVATSTSPDIEWITFTLERLPEQYDLFAIVRATTRFAARTSYGEGSSSCSRRRGRLRPRRRAREAHPGKMWQLADDGRTMRRCSTSRTRRRVACRPYQALPRVYHQNSALKIAWTRVVTGPGTREGRVLARSSRRASKASTSTTRPTGRAPSARRARARSCSPRSD